jgi:hypothetical protein
MKPFYSLRSSGAAKITFALAIVFCWLSVYAQDSVNGRYLFIFDTSSAMKKRLPVMTNQVDNLLESSMQRQLQEGDSIGVWMFDRELRSGVLPPQRWSADMASDIANNIKTVLLDQSFSKTTEFSALQPRLNELVLHSERLTVLIYTDGDGQFVGTPYDTDINAVFQEKRAAMKAAKLPFVLVLRSQLGKYVGASVDLPPGAVDLPAFPPLPVPVATNASSAPKVLVPPVAPPLIIIGTQVGTNPPSDGSQPVQGAPPSPDTIPVKPTPPLVTNITNVTTVTNYVVVEEKPSPQAALPATTTATTATEEPGTTAPPEISNSMSPTNGLTKPMPLDSTREGLVIGGVILLAIAGGLTTLLIGRSRRRNGPSLITQTLDKKP